MAVGDQYRLVSPVKLAGVYSTKKGNGKNEHKPFYINRNTIHQANHFAIAKAKRIYKELMFDQIAKLPNMKRIKVLYVVHRGDKRKADRGNLSYETCKFFLDALCNQGKLPDDSDEYFDYATHKTGDICKGNPHVEIYIEETA